MSIEAGIQATKGMHLSKRLPRPAFSDQAPGGISLLDLPLQDLKNNASNIKHIVDMITNVPPPDKSTIESLDGKKEVCLTLLFESRHGNRFGHAVRRHPTRERQRVCHEAHVQSGCQAQLRKCGITLLWNPIHIEMARPNPELQEGIPVVH